MFEASESAEIEMPINLHRPGEHIFEAMQIRLHIPWFYVAYFIRDNEGGTTSNMMFLVDIHQILNMYMADNIDIIEAYLVSPSYINNTGCWKMDKLKEIWGVNTELLNNLGLTYVMEDGREYAYSSSGLENENIKKENLLIRF